MMETDYTNLPISTLTDESTLIRQAQSGDAYAFAQLYDERVERVYRYITLRVENDRVAENITVWVFSKAWEQLDRYKISGSSFTEWLYAIARNEIIAYYRTHKRNAVQDNTVTMVVGGPYQSEGIQDVFELQAMRDGLQFLTGEEQQVLILKFIARLSNENIAHVMSKRESYVRTLQFRALQRLMGYLQEKEVI